MPRVLIRGFTVCINVFIVITSLSREVYSCERAIVKLHACFLPRVIKKIHTNVILRIAILLPLFIDVWVQNEIPVFQFVPYAIQIQFERCIC